MKNNTQPTNDATPQPQTSNTNVNISGSVAVKVKDPQTGEFAPELKVEGNIIKPSKPKCCIL